MGISGSPGVAQPGDTVLLRGGPYYLARPLVPNTGSGTQQITYAAYPYEIPVITGAQQISGWSSSGDGDCPSGLPTGIVCWQATLPSGITTAFDYLIYLPAGIPPAYVPMAMSRRSESLNTPSSYNTVVSTDGSTYVIVNDPQQVSYNLNDVKYYNFSNWLVDVLRVASANYNSGQTKFTFTSGSSNSGFNTNERFLISNSLEYFQSAKTPGTFYVDCGSGHPCVESVPSGSKIYYIANAGENPADDIILAPQLSQLIQVAGASNASAGYMTFHGIVFVGDNFTTAQSTGYVSQTGQPNITAALSFVDTQNVILDSCIIAHTAGWGLEFTNDSSTSQVLSASANNTLENSALYDIGASGLRLGRYPPNGTDSGNSASLATNNTTVENNLFLGTGRLYPNGEDGCLWIGSSNTNTIEHNDCGDSYGGGIAVGPQVGIGTDYVYNNTIEYNNFHDIGEGVIFDFGCVHFANYGGRASQTSGDVFENNVCRDLTHAVNDTAGNPRNGAAGIYIDNNSECILAQNNLVYRSSGELFFNNGGTQSASTCGSTSCMISGTGGGCYNLVSDNILAYAYEAPLRRGQNMKQSGSKGDPYVDFTFQNNIVYFDTNNNVPQLHQSGTNFWTCYISGGSYSTPCTAFFAFYSNDYWSTSGAQPTFVTSNGSSDVTWSFSTGTMPWQGGAPNAQEDLAVGSYPISINQDPGFTQPIYPFDNFGFSGSAPPTFDLSAFQPTYSAGRSNPLIFAPPVAPGFPLQPLSPFAF